ncbi:hypothetical protein COCVIDRAFT_40816 [Bipolaris victoriae FI3]|uniref:Methyltransferase type 11 domain-containing protein n=1 Tax=Bipolaris victoriae (strain FI3) TaxID=930091 RepID=W7E919_BIPV3|nr:hypothetical protein COCVIDRAFT_40816 [Bipolaris victoriae FI3]
MFATDLPLEKEPETFGARRERKAKERSVRSPSIGASTTSRSSRGSASTERDAWWPTSLKKANIIKPKIIRPPSGSSQSSQKTFRNVPATLDMKKAREFKDPALQPSWTYTSSLSGTLPSGNSLHLDEYHQLSELEGDNSSRQSSSISSHASNDRDEAMTPITVDSDDAPQLSTMSPESFVTSRSRASSSAGEHCSSTWPSVLDMRSKKKASPQPIKKGYSRPEALELYESFHTKMSSNDIRTPSFDSDMSNKPFSQWQCLAPREVPTEMQLNVQPQPSASILYSPNSSSVQLTRFQRFIRRMESAGPKVILDRLKEDWQEATSDGVDEELILEKQLWLLTGLQMQTARHDKSTPIPEFSTGKILELYGNLSEVYQLSAMHPSQMVHFLTTKPQRHVPLPGNVSYLTVRKFGSVPLPYPEDYFSHIRASTLPSLVPSSELPELFSECYKLLAPGGFLEIRVMDAAPVRTTAGPLMRAWIEDRLSVNLEQLFRCSKPCALLPAWLKDAGFELADQHKDQKLTLPCASDPESAKVDDELSTIIGRALWKDIWGSFVDDSPDEPKWWWEDKDIVEECVKRQTVLECRTIFAYKREVAP